VGDDDLDARMRILIRHQWVREHGTPRVTTLAGPRAAASGLWLEWLRLTGRKRERRLFFEQPTGADREWLEHTAARASDLAAASPRAPIAIVVDTDAMAGWLAARDDRLSAFIAEGVVRVDEPPRRQRVETSRRRTDSKARSLAELTLFDALESTPATTGRFRLNEAVSFHFGARAAEIDLLSRADDVAIEVDGFHHFSDPDHYRRDRRKDLLLQAHGYLVLRFLADDVLADPREAVRMVVELLGTRRARQRAPRRP